MLKLVGLIVVVLLAMAVYNDPSIVDPWAKATKKASAAVGEGFKKAGELTANSIVPPGNH